MAFSLPPPAPLAMANWVWKEISDPVVREWVAQRVENDVNGPDGDEWLLWAFGKIEDKKVRTAAIGRFGRNLYSNSINVIGRALDDPQQDVRDAARKALKLFKDQRDAKAEFEAWTQGDNEARASISALMKLLESPKKDVVIGAVKSLAAMKAKSALPALVKLLERDDVELKRAVDDAITKIGS